MSDGAVVGGGQGAGLSQVERVVDTFIAPSKTFTDILRSTSWWLPFLLLVVVSFGATAVVEKQVGWVRVAENQIHQNPKQEEKMAGLTDAQKANQMGITAAIYRYTSYGAFVFILVFVGLFALIYWASFNFGLGARTTYGQMFAVCMYASLPRLLTALLSIVTLLFGGSADSGIDPGMVPAVLWNMAAWLLWGAFILGLRYALERRRQSARTGISLHALSNPPESL